MNEHVDGPSRHLQSSKSLCKTAYIYLYMQDIRQNFSAPFVSPANVESATPPNQRLQKRPIPESSPCRANPLANFLKFFLALVFEPSHREAKTQVSAQTRYELGV